MDRRDKALASRERALDLVETAELIGFKPTGLRRALREGRGPAYFKAGRLIRFRLCDIEDWIEKNRVVPSGKGGGKR